MTRSTPVPVYMGRFLPGFCSFHFSSLPPEACFSFDRAQYANNAGIDMAEYGSLRFRCYAISNRTIRSIRYCHVAAIGAFGFEARFEPPRMNLSILLHCRQLPILSTFWSQELHEDGACWLSWPSAA